MLDLYTQTFVRVQFVTWLVAAAVVIATRDVLVGGAFLVAMQVGAVLGAAWGHRLRLKRLAPRQ
jgi:hypothetical protein